MKHFIGLVTVMLLYSSRLYAVDHDVEILDLGVLFHKEGDIFMSQTTWTLVVDLEVGVYRVQMKALESEINTLQDIHNKMREIGENGKMWLLELQRGIIQQRREECMMLMQDFGEMEDILQISRKSRGRRTVFEGADMVLKYLFGSPSKQDVTKLNNKLSKLYQGQSELETIVSL